MVDIFGKLKIWSIIILCITTATLYLYNSYLSNKNDELTTQNEQLTTELKNVKADIGEIKKINDNLYNNNIKLKNESNELNKKLSKLSNIDKMAQKHPEMLGNTLTNATRKANRCFEDISRDKECE